MKVKTARIGTDINMDINIQEGYAILEYDENKYLPDGTYPTDENVVIIYYIAEYLRKEMGIPVDEPSILSQHTIDSESLFEYYLEDKEGIDKFADCDYTEPPTNLHELLNLADVTHAYKGLQ